MLPLCKKEKQHPLELDIKIRYCFNKHYISEAISLAKDFLSPSPMKVDILRIFEMEENLKVMLENGPNIDEYWRPQRGNKVLLPGENYLEKEFYNSFISASLPKKHDGTQIYSLKKIYYDMLLDVSPLLTYGVSAAIFSKYVYKTAALALQAESDFDLLIRMIYSQSDKGDIYFFQHIYHNDDSILLIEKQIKLLHNEDRCKLLTEKHVKAMCFFVVGRVLALYSQMKNISEHVRKFKDVKKGVEFIDESISVFSSLNMSLTVAEAYSTKGLLQFVAGNKYIIGKMHYIKALGIIQNVYTEHPILAASYFNIGFMCYQMGEFNLLLAIRYFNISFDIYNKTLGRHRRTAYTAFYLGKSLQEVGKYIESMPILAKAYALQEEVMLADNNIADASRDSEKLIQIKRLHDNALKEAEFESSYFYPVEGWYHLRAAFQAMLIGNCHRGLKNIDNAKYYLNLSRHKLISLSNDNSNLKDFAHLLTDDIDEFLGLTDQPTVDKWLVHLESKFLYGLIWTVILILLTLAILFIYFDRYMFSDLDCGWFSL